jgi:vitamin B12 transporter
MEVGELNALSDQLFFSIVSRALVFFPLLLLCPDLGAQEAIPLPSVVISASRIEESVALSGSSVTQISQEEIRARESVTLEDVLRGVEGITLQSYQGRSDIFTALSLRGSELNQTLLLIDGVAVNSPYDQKITVGPVDLFNVDHIEVVRGPQSALYGSEAMGGVIQLFTSSPEPGTHWTFLGEGGNLRTGRAGISYAHSGDVAYRLSYARSDTHGDFSHSAIQSDQAGMELQWDHGTATLRTTFLYRKTDEEYFMICCALFDPLPPDDTTLPNIRFYEDSNAAARQDWTLVNVNYTNAPLSWLDYRLGVSHHEEIMEDHNPPESGVSGYYPLIGDVRIEGRRDRLEWQQNMRFQENDTWTLLLEYTREDAEKRERSNSDSSGLGPVVDQSPISGTRENKAVALQMLIDSTPHDRLTLGGRVDYHSFYGQAASPRAAYSHEVARTGTVLRAGYGEGIRAPSLDENFNPFRGNPDLKPEENQSYEIGLSQPFPWKSLVLSWTFHRTFYKNLIQVGVDPADLTSTRYVNAGHSVVKGHEGFVSFIPWRRWTLNVTYATLQTWDREAGQPLPFRPHFSLFVNARYQGERFHVNGELHRVGESLMPFPFLQDQNGNPIGDRMAGYRRVDLTGSYELVQGDRKVDLYARVDNLFDREIVEISGFPLPGRTYSAGIRAEF